uniref:DNA polymerase n=1 Tax=Chionoecetes opilio bacilliform virus TaxID=1825681 RepID=A0A1Q3DKW8_9VIRU|nr:DNA polymerase [Chionoecetes opilio bacilliform virus]
MDEEGKGMEYLGVITGIRDCVVTSLGNKNEIDGAVIGIGVTATDVKVTPYIISEKMYEAITRPSDCIETAMRNTTSTFKYAYTKSTLFDPILLHSSECRKKKMNAVARMTKVPISTVGVRIRIQPPEGKEKVMVMHNPSGVVGFNPFNSSPVFFEAHSEMDVLMMMTAFIKHNSLWGGITANIDLYKFDYVGAFFDNRWTLQYDTPSFMAARAQLLSSSFKCKTVIKNAAFNHKRKIGDDFPEADAFEMNSDEYQHETIRGCAAMINGTKCPHAPEKYHIQLDQENYCVVCFSSIFFVPYNICEGFVEMYDRSSVQCWVDMQMVQGADTLKKSNTTEQEYKDFFSNLADITQAAHGKDIPLGPKGRHWNWPQKKSSVLHEFIFYNLTTTFNQIRKNTLPEMNTGLLFRLMSPLGKMLLIFMNNNLVMNSVLDNRIPKPGGKADGRWWNVFYAGPNLWTFQITKCFSERRSIDNLSCMETLHRLPFPGEKITDERVIFKGFCRGESLSGVGEVISDITQSVNTVAMMLENRIFSVDEHSKNIITSPGVGDVICSLEVTGFRSNRAQDTINSGRVSARLMRILESREGAKVWHNPEHDALIVERVNHNVDISTVAMERAIINHKILFYDIETNTVDMAEDTAVITSICCCLCTAGDLKRGGERTIFGLAAPGTDPLLVEQAIHELYNNKQKEDGEEYIVTDHAPEQVCIYSNEFDMLMGFSNYIQERRPHVVSGWNSRSFDDAFVFIRIVKHLAPGGVVATADTVKSVLPGVGYTTARQRIQLANTGLFNLGIFMEKTGFMNKVRAAELLTGAESQAMAGFREQSKDNFKIGSTGWFQTMVGCCCTAIRLDMMKVSEKAYRESLSEFNLNAVLAKVKGSKIVKDVVDLHHHLLGFLKLKDPVDQAIVHVYCCKDAYLTGVVAIAINKGSEIFSLCMDSALIESVVVSNLTTPLCIGEGAICRNMGITRMERRGVGIRRHSMATDTKGGMVSQSIVGFVPYQTIDMTSLYPMAMIHNNLCVSTFVTHRQVIDLRDRMVEQTWTGKGSLLEVVDECNLKVLEYYRPNDIPSWLNNNTNLIAPVTRLEKRLKKIFVLDKEKGEGGWCDNSPPNVSMKAAGLDYFPEVVCDINVQQAAKANDDMHIAPSSLEYMLQVLPILVLGAPHMAAQLTAGQCQNVDDLIKVLEEEFNEERDIRIIERRWTFAGNTHHNLSKSPVSDKVVNIIKRTGRRKKIFEQCTRIRTLLDRIFRRVSVYDSADDPGVRLWSSRLINIGMLVRTWNIKHTELQGIIPSMQKRYRSNRVIMQKNVKLFRISDPKRADLNSVGEKTAKLAMNSLYGCLALRARSTKTEFKIGAASNSNNIANMGKTGGVGGGTRHSTTANQITEISRCVFGNIGCALQQALPGIQQTYGDTDSVFCVHNIPGDGGEMCWGETDSTRVVYPVDILLKCKMAQLTPLLVNSTTKGIHHVPRRDAGEGVMNIAHERLAVQGFLFAKKTYHMLHFNEHSVGFTALQDVCKKACLHEVIPTSINKFVTLRKRPTSADNFIVPHNPTLILGVAETNVKLKSFLEKEGVYDKMSLALWLKSSAVWVELNASVLNNLYVSKMVDVEKGYWIDEVTSKLIEGGPDHDAVTQADAVFTSYKKGAFVKKGISTATKLKGLQSLFARQVPGEMNPDQRYMTVVNHHVQNYASHTTDPSMMITSSRVNKLDTDVLQTRPNPLAVAINNQLNPNGKIYLGDKFKSVVSVSAWSLLADTSEIPAGYYNKGGVRWNAEYMKGSLSCHTIKNMSVVPNAIAKIYDMLQADKTTINSSIKKIANVLSTAAALSGFSLRKGALSFNTGVIITNDLALMCIKMVEKDTQAFKGLRHNTEFEEEEFDEQEDEISSNVTVSISDMKNNTEEGILARLLTSTWATCPGETEREKAVALASDKKMGMYLTNIMELDPRVASQTNALIRQSDIVKDVCTKKKTEGIYMSKLDKMVAEAKVNFGDVLKVAAAKTKSHWSKCPGTIPIGRGLDNEEFRSTLQALSGEYKCTKTCDSACCQSLYFVILTTLALKIENERRRAGIIIKNMGPLLAQRVFGGDRRMAEIAVTRILAARRDNIVMECFPKSYNRDSDRVVLLFEHLRIPNKPVASMTVGDICNATCKLSETKTTGKIWDCVSLSFFGQIQNVESMDEDMACHGVEQLLTFHTGTYHRSALEIAAACLSVYLE